MKTQIKKASVLGLLTLMASFGAYGQKRAQERTQMLAPTQFAALQTKKMILSLDLDKQQQKAVEKLFLEQAKERETLRDKRVANKTMKKERPSQAVQYERSMAQLDKKIAHKRAMKEILSEEQFQKWERSMKTKQRKRGNQKERLSRKKPIK